jgi:hypothetical protein
MLNPDPIAEPQFFRGEVVHCDVAATWQLR